MNNIVAIVFRLINFAVLIGIIAYLFKTKIAKLLELRVAQKESVLERLQSKQVLLEDQESELEDTKEELAEEHAALKQKIRLWNEQVETVMAQKKEEISTIQKRAAERARQKSSNFTNQKIKEQAIQHAVNNATKNLEKKFQDTKQADMYLQNIVTFMEQDNEA